MRMFTPDEIQCVKESTDLVRLIGQDVELKKRGSVYKGLCPFHREKTPSFQVHPGKKFYHCWGCGANGDAIKWLTERENLSFSEAMERLLRKG